MRLTILVLSTAVAAFCVPSDVLAQFQCEEAPGTTASTAPRLDGFRLYTQQNAVSFYTRAPGAEAAGPVQVVIRNANPFPVEVSYSVAVDLRDEAAPRQVSVGQHCVTIPARQYAVTEDESPGPATVVRIRNLSVSNLRPRAATTPPTPAGERTATGATRPSAAAPAPSASAGSSRPSATQADTGAGVTDLPDAALADTGSLQFIDPAPVAAPESTAGQEAEAAPPVGDEPAPAATGVDGRRLQDRVLEIANTTFYLLSAGVMIIAGLALVLPTLAAVGVLLLSAVGRLLVRSLRGEGG